MSVLATQYVEDLEVSSSGAKGLLFALAAASNQYGVCWRGRTDLARKCCCSEKTVTERMLRLEGAKLIARYERRSPKGRRTSDWIVIAPFRDRTPMLDAVMDPGAMKYPDEVLSAASSVSRVVSSPETDAEVLDRRRRERAAASESRLQGDVSSGETSASQVKFSPSSGEVSDALQVSFSGGPDPLGEPIADPSVDDPASPSGDVEAELEDSTSKTIDRLSAMFAQRPALREIIDAEVVE